MDPEIRRRLLELPDGYHNYVLNIRTALHEVAVAKSDKEARRTELAQTLLPKWTAERSNETTRKAQLDGLLLEDSIYQEAIERAEVVERTIKVAQLELDALQFESRILQTIAGNDSIPVADDFAARKASCHGSLPVGFSERTM